MCFLNLQLNFCCQVTTIGRTVPVLSLKTPGNIKQREKPERANLLLNDQGEEIIEDPVLLVTR